MTKQGISSLAVVLTRWCNLSCAHCGARGGPRRLRRSIDPELAREAIDAASRRGASLVAFTGGETFAFPELLRDLVTHARRAGLAVEVATNAFWARTPEVAERALEPLVRAGLCELLVSYDDFHEAELGTAPARNAVHAAVALGVNVQVRVVHTLTTRIFGDTAAAALEIPQGWLAPPSPRVTIVARPVLPVGRASAGIRDEAFARVPAREWLDRPCSAVLHKPTLSRDGVLHACCSMAGLPIEGRPGGGPFAADATASVEGAFLELESRLLLNLIAAIGPVGVIERAGDRSGRDLLLGRRLVSVCEACHLLAHDAALEKPIAAFVDTLAQEAA